MTFKQERDHLRGKSFYDEGNLRVISLEEVFHSLEELERLYAPESDYLDVIEEFDYMVGELRVSTSDNFSISTILLYNHHHYTMKVTHDKTYSDTDTIELGTIDYVRSKLSNALDILDQNVVGMSLGIRTPEGKTATLDLSRED